MEEYYETDKEYSEEEFESEVEKDDEECPTINISTEEKRCNFCQSSHKTLIPKLLGKCTGFKFLEQWLTYILIPKTSIQLANLSNDYYLA